MKQVVTTGIVLTRINYGEADRILTILTPDQGKVRLLAKGVRRSASKLAGGIELFSISNITYLETSGELKRLISSRLIEHFGQIVRDLERTMLGYRLIKMLNYATEEATGEEYFELLRQTLIGLNDSVLDQRLVELWFHMQLLKLAGHTPSLTTDAEGKKLEPAERYLFDFEAMSFTPQVGARFTMDHLKFLRLGLSVASPTVLGQIENAEKLINDSSQLINSMLKYHIRV